VLPVGELEFPGSMLDQLRKLGMTVELDNGKIMLKSMFIVASKGVPLTPEQAKVLVHMKMQLISFKISLVGSWCDSQFEELH
jgi:mRNA turnover protein 4